MPLKYPPPKKYKHNIHSRSSVDVVAEIVDVVVEYHGGFLKSLVETYDPE